MGEPRHQSLARSKLSFCVAARRCPSAGFHLRADSLWVRLLNQNSLLEINANKSIFGPLYAEESELKLPSKVVSEDVPPPAIRMGSGTIWLMFPRGLF